MANIALLITGELRFENEISFNSFLDNIKGYDIYISTYSIYEKIARKISDNVIFLDKQPTYKTKKYQGNMYQWWHLQTLIRRFKDKLDKYTILYRLRTDINLPKELFNQDVNKQTIYCIRDLIFFGRKLHFIRLFENFFDDILNKFYGIPNRYLNINYNNFIKTKNPCYMWQWFTYPKFIYNNDFNIIKANMINNINRLNDINKNNIKCNFISGLPPRIYNTSKFASERIFPLHCINNGFLEGVELQMKLYNNRHNFDYIG